MEASWRGLGGFLGGPGSALKASGERPGGVLGRLGTSWGHLGGVLERLKDHLGCFLGGFICIIPFFLAMPSWMQFSNRFWLDFVSEIGFPNLEKSLNSIGKIGIFCF